MYKTTYDLSTDLRQEIPKLTLGAKSRIENLIFIIQDLRWQLREAQQQVIIANQQLHDILCSTIGGAEVDISMWGAGGEYEMKAFDGRAGSKFFDILMQRVPGEWRWGWGDSLELLNLLDVGPGDLDTDDEAALQTKKTARETKKSALEQAVKELNATLDVAVAADANEDAKTKANVNGSLLGTAVVLEYLEKKQQGRKAEWQVASNLAREWMAKALKDNESGVEVSDYLEKVNGTNFLE